MKPRWTDLDERDRATFQTVFAFLRTRLLEQQSIDWALSLREDERAARLAVLELIDREARQIVEPWQSVWRLIEECWNTSDAADQRGTGVFLVKKRLQGGERSGAVISAIIDLVAPRIELQSASTSTVQIRRRSRNPRSVHEILSTRLTSGTYIDPHDLGIDTLVEQPFLFSLAQALDAAVLAGLDAARRIGWDGKGFPLQLGTLHRVYHAASNSAQDPDKYRRGIAPSVKLLYETVARLAAVDASLARQFSQRWRVTPTSAHERLWCALARNSAVADATEVAEVLLTADDERFWHLYYFPEFTELRAGRFRELDAHHQEALAARIRKLPPRRHWRGQQPPDSVKHERLARALGELKRIEIGGGTLPPRERAWFDSQVSNFPELMQITRVDEGFLVGAQARWVPPNPDRSYDTLNGKPRLQALETAFSMARRRWDDNPAERASDWLRDKYSANTTLLIADLESLHDAGATFPKVWESFGWSHAPPQTQKEETAVRDIADEATRVFALLSQLPIDTIRHAIEGITTWVSAWDQHLITQSPIARRDLWMKLWPLAIDATNARATEEKARQTNEVKPDEARSRTEMDTLNTPVGKLTGVFLHACPALHPNDHPFATNNPLREMRDSLVLASGRSRTIVLHRLIEDLPYFLKADPEWAQEHLTLALNGEDSDALALWDAIARQTRFHDVLTAIGKPMTFRAADPMLSRETRQALAFSLVVECLYALTSVYTPAVSYSRVQQMLRSVDDETRAHAADAVTKFVSEVPGTPGVSATSSEGLFQTAATPFLRDVWPQERSLTTPGIARAFASLPAAAVGNYSEAVEAIERFLVPFECWSLYEYGLYSDGEGKPTLQQIDDAEKAKALLRLLNLTIGTAEGSVIPSDLGAALHQIRAVAPALIDDRLYRRLTAAARRT